MIRYTISPRVQEAYARHFDLEIGKPVETCIAAGCAKAIKPGKSICAAHDMRVWRKTHTVTAQYARLKAEAKKRKKVFDITLEEWAELCRLTRYHEGTASQVGSIPNGLTIDRIRSRGGYTLDNVRVIVQRLNSAKGAQEMEARLSNGKAVLLYPDAKSVAEQLEEDLETQLARL